MSLSRPNHPFGQASTMSVQEFLGEDRGQLTTSNRGAPTKATSVLEFLTGGEERSSQQSQQRPVPTKTISLLEFLATSSDERTQLPPLKPSSILLYANKQGGGGKQQSASNGGATTQDNATHLPSLSTTGTSNGAQNHGSGNTDSLHTIGMGYSSASGNQESGQNSHNQGTVVKNGSATRSEQGKTFHFLTTTPETVMKLYMNKLTPYEHHEIFNYPLIYFIGANAKKRPGIIGMPHNNDYDNEQGSYIHVPHDHVAYRYEVLKVIGKGSFGQVVKAYDHKKFEHVALKMVRNEKRFHRQAQEEIRILKNLREQDTDNSMNIIHMFDSFTFRNHMCITFELLSINLYELIKKNRFQGFSLQLVRKFSHSLLQCLDALYKNKIIHCDMKPENVLLKQQGRSGIKVIYYTFSFAKYVFLINVNYCLD